MTSLFRFRRARGPIDLAMDMVGVRLGERVLQAGPGNPKLLAKIAGKAGLSGRACAVVDHADAKAPLEAAAAAEGVLVDVMVESGAFWPLDAGAFDVAIVDGNALLRGTGGERSTRLSEVRRVVRPGGRVLVIRSAPLGLAGRLGFARSHADASPEAVALLRDLEGAGFKPARILAEREGLTFVEGFRAS